MQYNPYKGYKGLRTNFRYAYDCKIKVDNERMNRERFYRASVQEHLQEFVEWCEEHTTGNWSCQGYRFFFDKRDDLVLFKLTNMGRI